MKTQQQKRLEAEDRKVAYGRLSVEQKIERAKEARGNSSRQLERLYSVLGKRNIAKVQSAVKEPTLPTPQGE